MKTLREKFIDALLAMGEKEVKRTFKYIVFSRTINGTEHGNYYIGKNGALREGYTVAGSYPCSEKFKQKLLEKV